MYRRRAVEMRSGRKEEGECNQLEAVDRDITQILVLSDNKLKASKKIQSFNDTFALIQAEKRLWKMVQRKQKKMHISLFKISHLANNLGLAVEETEDCKEKLKLLEDRQKEAYKKRLSFGKMAG